jgi:hypothetical protein
MKKLFIKIYIQNSYKAFTSSFNMKFQFYYEKLINSEEYQKFKKEHESAYPCSGFFVLDREKGNNKVHFDFWLPNVEKMYSFKMDGPIEFVNVENFDKRPFEKLSMNYTFDLEEIEKIIIKKLEENLIKGRIQKILFSLQKLNGKDYLLGTVFLSNLGLIKTTIEIPENKITSFEKKSFFDMLKVVKGKNKEFS